MLLWEYKDYEEYRAAQEDANLKKWNRCFVLKQNVEMLSAYIRDKVPDLSFGICHGTRLGKEQEWFRDYLDIEVVGTEISCAAEKFPHTIQWDFHDVKPEWVGAVDFIYSNSLDHSWKPFKCLDAWMSCIKPGGVCILEWSECSIPSSKSDPFGATEAEYEAMILAKYNIKDRLHAMGKVYPTTFFVIAHAT